MVVPTKDHTEINARNAHKHYHWLKAEFREQYWQLYVGKVKAYEDQYEQAPPMRARSDLRHEVSDQQGLFNSFECCSIEGKNIFGYKPYMYEHIFNALKYNLNDGFEETTDYLLRIWPEDVERAKAHIDPNDRADTSYGFWSLCDIEFTITYLAEWEGLCEALEHEIETHINREVEGVQKPETVAVEPRLNLVFNADRYHKIDLIRLGIAFDKLRFLVKEDGTYPSRKEIMQFLEGSFKAKIADYASNYSHGKKLPIGEQVKLFEEMVKSIEKENKE